MEVSVGVVVLHMVIYIAAVFILKALYFDPVLKLLKRREALTKGRESSGADLLQKIAEFKESYSKQVEALKKDLEAKREKALHDVREESSVFIERVRNENEVQLKEHQKKMDQQLEKISETLPDLGSRLGDEIVEAVMNSKVVRAS